eukprot:NODE_208_length_14728_cov_0.400164.p1 type:complete len:673 gc:universal NODE_208_length_14728_cov_0.400164:3443-5461(+)
MLSLPIATTCINVHALDVENNARKILESINLAYSQGATIRCAAELELSGYSCLDHFYENDLIRICVDNLIKIIKRSPNDILCFVGCPLEIHNKLYNCLVVYLNKEIKLIRPKGMLCDDGNYRESRYFTAWPQGHLTTVNAVFLHSSLNGNIPFGDALLESNDVCIGIEMCEELFITRPFHCDLYLNGAQVVINSSGSHHQLRKLNQRVQLVKHASIKGAYIYNNLRGCDGERVYFDGSNMIFMNGDCYYLGEQFSLVDIEVKTTRLYIQQVFNNSRQQPSRTRQNATLQYQRISINFDLLKDGTVDLISKSFEPNYCSPEEEIALGPACYLWDYLRKSGLSGVFIPLSGGVDSCAVALIVYSMCRLVVESINKNNQTVKNDVLKLIGFVPKSCDEMTNHVLHTAYMSTEYSSLETKERALGLANLMNAYHVDVDITAIVNSFITTIATVLNKPDINNSVQENIALQNVQARSRMVLSYLFSILMPWHRNKKGNLLVLGTANVDESLRGYFTKYDCSSADLNLIGSISKNDLKLFVSYCKVEFKMELLSEFINATPTAELRPTEDCQSDEKEMMMTYKELTVYGRLRKIARCGPLAMFERLLLEWPDLTPTQVYEKVKTFFYYYGINRHKMTVITPSYHAESYSPDDNRFDLRPFLYKSWDSFYTAIESYLNK